jgi:ABC-type transporter Mla subunit MlaD
MPSNEERLSPAVRELPLLMAAQLQDSLMMATHDLERLQRLLDDAYAALIDGFQGAAQQLDAVRGERSIKDDSLEQTLQTLHKAVTALQFQDMATQLIYHTSKRLRSCADQIARDAMGDDPDGMAFVEESPSKPNPVTQDEMDAGSVELF